MTRDDFKKLKYFVYDERNHKGKYIFYNEEVLKNTSLETMLFLESLRKYEGKSVIIHCLYEPGGHSEKSQHYKKPCTAVDFHIANTNYTDAIAHVCAVIEEKGYKNKCGLGIYPDWENPGFHFDLRGVNARWGARNVFGKQSYTSFEDALAYAVGKHA